MHSSNYKMNLNFRKKFNLIDFKHIFYLIREQPYVIDKNVKIDDLKPGGFLNIYCFNIGSFVNNIIKYGNEFLIKDIDININSSLDIKTQIFFVVNNDMEIFTLNIYDKTPKFNNVIVEPNYIYSIIENAESKNHDYNGNKFPIFFPSKVDKHIMQYIDYLEKHEFMPKGDNFYSTITNMPSNQRISFYDKINIYVKRKVEDYDSYSSNLIFKRRLTVNQIKSIINKLPSPFADLVMNIAKKIFKTYHGRN